MTLTAPESTSNTTRDHFDALFEVSRIPAANVASVPQRSPLRYPGGKTWLVPHIREWLMSMPERPSLLLEPFCGGAIVSLTAVAEDLVKEALMAEKDPDVSAFWHAAIHHGDELRERMLSFDLTLDSIMALAQEPTPDSILEHGFRTLVLNRTRRGGILAEGATLFRSGENGKGLKSRWYPETLAKRLDNITQNSDRITFKETDGLALLEKYAKTTGLAVFADPPYTANGGKQAGKRLYSYNQIDHALLFKILADSETDFLMTYDASEEVVDLIAKHRFHAVHVKMKTTHHTHNTELIITPRQVFCG